MQKLHSQNHHVSVEEQDIGQRLDKFLAAHVPDLSRTRAQALLDMGAVTSGKDARIIKDATHKVKAGEAFCVTIPDAIPSEMRAVEMDLSIIFEDDDLLIINKPAGLTVHPAPGHADDTLVNALLAHCKGSLSGIGGVERPGIVHRIDKDTSGLLVVAKNDITHASLSKQLKDRTLSRTYQALVWGVPSPREGIIEASIGRNPHNRKKMAVVKNGGKPSVTHYQVLEAFHVTRAVKQQKGMQTREALAAWVQCELETGRTHQIRVHLTHNHHPIIGDPVYGQETSARLRTSTAKALPSALYELLQGFNRQALHAYRLTLQHPKTLEILEFEAPLPDDFQQLLGALQHLHSA